MLLFDTSGEGKTSRTLVYFQWHSTQITFERQKGINSS